ncbi:MAG: response regulator [Rhodospirillaceae bacterium]|nr:response regulator [Rhodospirillaceae bacterium]MDD9918940.1 response regulator [Rhodospirillaceae bacterium]
MTDNDLMRARILVVEDDDTMRDFIVEILGSVGFTNLTTALDGIEAWRKFEQGEQFDLVICDWIMPGMDGLEVLKNIRDSRAAIPFILVTVRDSEDAIKRAVDRGVTAFLSKPFMPDQLVGEVLKVLSDSSVLEHSTNAEVWEF